MSRSTFNILFIVRKTKVNQMGLAPIRVRVTIGGEAIEFSTQISIPPALWDARTGKATGRTRMAADANTSIDKVTTRLHTKYREVDEKLGYVTPVLLKNAFFGVDEKTTTLLALFDKKIDLQTHISCL